MFIILITSQITNAEIITESNEFDFSDNYEDPTIINPGDNIIGSVDEGDNEIDHIDWIRFDGLQKNDKLEVKYSIHLSFEVIDKQNIYYDPDLWAWFEIRMAGKSLDNPDSIIFWDFDQTGVKDEERKFPDIVDDTTRDGNFIINMPYDSFLILNFGISWKDKASAINDSILYIVGGYGVHAKFDYDIQFDLISEGGNPKLSYGSFKIFSFTFLIMMFFFKIRRDFLSPSN